MCGLASAEYVRGVSLGAVSMAVGISQIFRSPTEPAQYKIREAVSRKIVDARMS